MWRGRGRCWGRRRGRGWGGWCSWGRRRCMGMGCIGGGGGGVGGVSGVGDECDAVGGGAVGVGGGWDGGAAAFGVRAGDRWVVPGLVELLGCLPVWVEGGRARLSLVSVDELAGVLAELAVGEGRVGGGVLHAGHPEPVSVRVLVETVAGALGLGLPVGEVDLAGALELVGGAQGGVLARRVRLLGVDRWYDSGRLWSRVGVSPGPGFVEAFAACAPWYRSVLSGGNPA